MSSPSSAEAPLRASSSAAISSQATPAELFLLYRRRSGWSQTELGRQLGGVSGRAVRNWESGYNLPKPTTLLKLIALYLEAEVFLKDQERDEASHLWRRVKTVFDNSTERLEAYPVFDEAGFRQRVRERAERQTTSPAPIAVASDPPPGVPRVVPGNLPPLPSHLLERRQETQSVIAALSQTRLLTLTGPGGVGKTTLQLMVGAAMQSEFPDGVYWVELAPLTTAEAPLAATTRALRIAEEADRPLIQTLCDSLREKRALLILDNIEHLLDGCATLIWDVIRACPHVKILTSGRETLRLRDEMEWRVPALRVPDHKDETNAGKLASLLECESVELFLQRARHAGSYFDLTRQSALAVARICRQLDGIPLAIELAAARTAAFGVESLAQRLEKDFQLLSAGYRDAPHHHQTMQASIQWSYDLTTPAEQRLWQVLSLFSGGWTLPAAEAVCHDCGSVADTLAGLADKSVVVVGETGGTVRYRFLETLRQFGAEKLGEYTGKSGDEARLRDNHLSYFAVFTAKIASELIGPNAAFAALQIEADYPNLRSALEWSAAEGGDASRLRDGITLALALQDFWFTRNSVSEARPQVTSLIEAARLAELSETREFARLLSLAGTLAQSQSDFAVAHSYLTEAIQRFEASENWGDMGIALRSLTHGTLEQGDYERTEMYFERTQYALRQVQDVPNLAICLLHGGVAAGFRGDFAAAETRLEESLRLSQMMGIPLFISRAFFGQGVVAARRERYADAERLFQNAIDLMAGSNQPRAIAHHINFLGTVAVEQGDRDKALRLYQESLRLWRNVGMKIGLTLAITGVADWLITFDAPQKSEAYERAALLCGAVSALLLRLDSRLTPIHQRLFDRTMQRARAALSQAAFATTFTEGQTMPLERAVALSLSVGP